MTKSVFSDRYDRFREALVRARKGAKLTQEDVAKRLAKPQSFVSKYERGERRLDVVEFFDIAKAVGFEPLGLLMALGLAPEAAKRKRR
ncbi:MAG: transcriptional [Planctomycetota bacterium]|nr:MAG: transcriptional [Planctomycetota bacterium]